MCRSWCGPAATRGRCDWPSAIFQGRRFPGEAGNVGLAGHRDTFFRRLRDIRPDDEVRIVTPEATFIYRVERTDVVEPTDVWVLDHTERADP